MSEPEPVSGAEVPEGLRALRAARPAPAVEHRIVEGAMARAMGPRPRALWPWAVAALATAAALAAVLPGQWAASPEPSPAPAEALAYVTDSADGVLREEAPAPNQKVVHLTTGTATFTVAPVPKGGLFAVQTPHARVEVVGTRFTVAVADQCSRVSVAEGKVRVRRDAEEFFVAAGESREICRGGAAGEAMVRRALADLAAGRDAEARARLEAYLAAEPAGFFAEEALYYLAVAARRGDDRAAAQAATERFLARFPHGPRAERLRAALPPSP